MGNIIALGQPALLTLLENLEYLQRISICLNIMSCAMPIIGFLTTLKGKGISAHIMNSIVVDLEL
jgi:hypothetical protein